MDAITPPNGDPTLELIERCCEAWGKVQRSLGKGAGQSQP
jgi:hypothetical protein